ncbi:zinc finger CCCH domain-containing protein 14 isoform X1 [Dermacentor albipictus]|uniref:zinc finger CCCH domain-containing protein 14 isoform X1 n=1 Tax=Dermacentor albipictus TaxID=60249 RepID=UPI0031FD9DB0
MTAMDGNEVTQKIRAAIKTKLMELGAYVDDELPDYIMVMIANKKTKEQMTQDLSLFLGDSTVNFTSWLQGVLDHLQAIATEAKQRGKEEQPRALLPGEPVRPVLPPHLDATRQQKSEPTPVAPTVAVAPPPIKEEPFLPEYSDEVLALKAEPEPDDDLADDLRAIVEQAPATRQRTASSGAGSSSSVSLVRPIPRMSAPEQTLTSKERPTKKSVVAPAAVVRRKPHFLSEAEEDDEEEYDPSNPSVGSIASVVKVSERRSSVPENMQANKLLLLKAMKAAHQSVSSTARRNPSARVEPYQPTPLRELGSKRRRPASRLGSTRASDADDEDSMPPAKRSSGLSIKERLGRRRASTEEPMASYTSEQAPGLTRASRIVGAIAPEVRPDTRAREKSMMPAPAADAVVIRDNVSLEQDDADLLELDVAHEDVHSVVKDTTPTSTPSRLSGADDSTPGRQGSSGSTPSSSQWPRFVVTLDGVDPTSFKSSNSHRDVLTTGHDLEELPEEEEEQLVPAASQRPPVKSRLMIAPVSDAELMEEACVVEEEEAMAVDNGAPQILEKCRYWPACKNGDRCPFHHPSVPCKAFPNCKYRDKCLFIHPNCKYDAFCKRKDCLFTHASRRSFACPPPVVSSPSVQHCKFYPHCTNLKCPFFHPKPCKFGPACQSSSCPYSHPEGSMPPPNKLKWTSATAKKAGETAA